MNTKEIHSLIKFVAESGVAEIKLKTDEFAIHIKNIPEQIAAPTPMPVMQQPVVQSVPHAAEAQTTTAGTGTPAQDEKDNSNYITIKSPMIGTFYRKPSPDKDVFVNVGDSIQKGDVVCIIEAMKLFNEIESEISGKIVKVLVDDSTPVEYDQPLFLVEPS